MNTTNTGATCDFIHEEGPAEGTHHLYGGDHRFFTACPVHARRHGMAFPRVRELGTGIEITTESVGTDLLKTGDVLHLHDARLVIDQEITAYPSGKRGHETVYVTSARIDNWDELTELTALYPTSPAARLVARQVSPEHRWTVQGGRSSLWAREVRTQN